VRSWELARTIPAPDGKALQQTYTCEVTWAPGAETFQRVREWAVNPLGGGSVAYRDTTVKKSEPLTAGAPVSLTVPLPQGALVADARNGSPVEYELLDADPGNTSPPLSTNVQKPAPAFEVRSTEKKTLKLSDYRRKPLVIVWFSAGSAAVASAAEALDAFHGEYRKKGIQFLALEVSTSADAAQAAEAFRKSSGWSFPVAVDPGGALLAQFGLRRAIPAVALVDGDGKIVYGRAGLDPTTLTAALDVVKK
jgi:peroxiredoxin